jgi:hypothetical protein
VTKCKLCGEQELPGHVCAKPKPKLRPIMKTQSIYNYNTQPYYNAVGKKVRDQASQTMLVNQPTLVKAVEEQKLANNDRNSSQNSPVKIESRAAYRTNSSDESTTIRKFWKNEKAFPGLVKNSRQSPAWKHGDKK